MAVKREVDRTHEEKPRASGLRVFLPSWLPFFALSFAYLWLVVEPRLIYYSLGTILPDARQFAPGWSFLSDSLSVPGGFVAYAAGLLSLGFYHSWLGAGIIILAGLCLAELTRRHLAKAGLTRVPVAALVPALALFLIYSDYKHPLPVSLAVSAGLLLSLVFERLPLRASPARVPALCLLAAVGFWLGGTASLLVLAILTVIYAAFVRRDWATAILALPAGAGIAWALAEYLFLVPPRQALLALAPPATIAEDDFLRGLILVLHGFVPLAVLLVFLGKRLFGVQEQKSQTRLPKTKGRQKHAGTPQKRLSLGGLAKPALTALPILLMILGLYFSRDNLRKPYVLSNYYWHQKQWDNILELARRLPQGHTTPFVNHDILRALYHTGRLPYDMFRFPLVPEAILLTHETRESDLTQLKLSDLFLELGHVNMAQKLASELVATKDHPAAAIEKLGWISIIKGHPSTARVYLEALKKDPIQRGTAQSLLRGLDKGFTPDQTAYIDRIQSYMRGETAGVTGTEAVDLWLAALLEHNPRNKMAFEYLMACYLVTGRVEKIVENMRRLRDLRYQEIPTLYEEAILIHCGPAWRKASLAGFSISQETLRRYERFVQIASAMQSSNRQTAFNQLVREFGTSYFFYRSFGRVGVM